MAYKKSTKKMKGYQMGSRNAPRTQSRTQRTTTTPAGTRTMGVTRKATAKPAAGRTAGVGMYKGGSKKMKSYGCGSKGMKKR